MTPRKESALSHGLKRKMLVTLEPLLPSVWAFCLRRGELVIRFSV